MRPRFGIPLLAAVLLLGSAPLALAAEGEAVEFETLDHVTIRGTLYAPSGWVSGSAVIGLHMFLGDRRDWGDFHEELTKRNITFLAIDLRGHGKSRMRRGEDLRPKALDQDPKLYSSMYRDVEAAVRFLEKKGFDRARIGLAGASLGAGVALDYASRNPSVPCVGLLTPIFRMSGISLTDAAKKYGDRPAIILCSEKELGKGARALASRLLTGPQVRLEVHKGETAHGTALLESMPGANEMLGEWFAARLAADIRLDGVVRGRESARAELRRIDDRDPGKGSLLIRRFPDHLYIAARTRSRPQELEVNIAGRLFRFNSEGFRRTGGKHDISLPLPAGSIRSIGREAIELLLPVGGFGLARGEEIRMSVRLLSGGEWSNVVSGLRIYFARLPSRKDSADR